MQTSVEVLGELLCSIACGLAQLIIAEHDPALKPLTSQAILSKIVD